MPLTIKPYEATEYRAFKCAYCGDGTLADFTLYWKDMNIHHDNAVGPFKNTLFRRLCYDHARFYALEYKYPWPAAQVAVEPVKASKKKKKLSVGDQARAKYARMAAERAAGIEPAAPREKPKTLLFKPKPWKRRKK